MRPVDDKATRKNKTGSVPIPFLKLLFVGSLCCFIPLAAGGREKRAAAARLLALREDRQVGLLETSSGGLWFTRILLR